MRLDEKKTFYERRLKVLDRVVSDLSFQLAVYLNQLSRDRSMNKKVWASIVHVLEDAYRITNKMLVQEALSSEDKHEEPGEPLIVYPDEDEWEERRRKALVKRVQKNHEKAGLTFDEIMKRYGDDGK